MQLVLKRLPVYRFSLATQNKLPRRLMDQQPARQKLFSLQDKNIEYNPFQALQLMRLHSFASFHETVDVCIRLGVNPKNGDQIVRGSAVMPSGLGKDITIAVICDKSDYKQAEAMGATVFIDNEKLKGIANGVTEFDRLFSTPEMLPKLKPFGKVLGPRGLMPNAKIGTLTSGEKLFAAIKEAKSGQVTFRVDTGKNLHAPLGKLAFTDDQIMLNWKSLMLALAERRPPSLKGKYFREAFLKSTMGPRWRIKLAYIDPKNKQNIWGLIQ